MYTYYPPEHGCSTLPMKKYLVSFAFAVLFFAGCKQDSGVDDLRKEIEALKSTEIASINSQITGIKSSITNLVAMDSELKGYISTLQAQATDLAKADEALTTSISELKTEIYGKISEEKAAILQELETQRNTIQGQINTINTQITALHAKDESLSEKDEDLQAQIDQLRQDLATLQGKYNDLTSSISTLESSLASQISAAEGNILAELNGYKATVSNQLQTINQTIAALQAKDEDLQMQINNLKNYVDSGINSAKDWVSATFVTLEKYNQTSTIVAGIQTQIEAINATLTTITASNWISVEDMNTAISGLDNKLQGIISQSVSECNTALTTAKAEITAAYTTAIQNAITSSESSMKTWVNNQLTGYYTIAQTDAKLKLLEDAYKAGDTSLAGDIKELQESLNTAKSDLTAAYQKAIADAITENNGTINKKIADDIKAAADNLQSQINTINTRIDALESRLAALEASVAELIGMVQSIVVVPDYSDGSVKMTSSSDNIIRFEVYPLSAAKALAQKGPSVFSLDYVETETKASMFKNIPITSVSFNGEVLLIEADGGEISPSVFAGVKSANARLRISDGTAFCSSEFFQLSLTFIPEGAVDLGLSVYWASCNLGANKPEEAGSRYAWGETESKTYFSDSNYKWLGYEYDGMPYYTKYNATDNKTQLDLIDDAAYVNLGGKWRMPTKEEWEELENNCWVTDDVSNNRIIVTSKIEGYKNKKIYLPCNKSYWLSSLSNISYIYGAAPYAATYYTDYGTSTDNRFEGLYIRPVSD